MKIYNTPVVTPKADSKENTPLTYRFRIITPKAVEKMRNEAIKESFYSTSGNAIVSLCKEAANFFISFSWKTEKIFNYSFEKQAKQANTYQVKLLNKMFALREKSATASPQKLLEKAAKIASSLPDNRLRADSLMEIAYTLAKQGHPKEALQTLKAAAYPTREASRYTTQRPTQTYFRHEWDTKVIKLAEIFISKNKPDMALKACRTIKSTSIDILKIRAIAYASKEDYTAAIGCISNAISKLGPAPEYSGTSNGADNEYMDADYQHGQASQELKNFMMQRPNIPLLLNIN